MKHLRAVQSSFIPRNTKKKAQRRKKAHDTFQNQTVYAALVHSLIYNKQQKVKTGPLTQPKRPFSFVVIPSFVLRVLLQNWAVWRKPNCFSLLDFCRPHKHIKTFFQHASTPIYQRQMRNVWHEPSSKPCNISKDLQSFVHVMLV